jgi:hypothetical protein
MASAAAQFDVSLSVVDDDDERLVETALRCPSFAIFEMIVLTTIDTRAINDVKDEDDDGLPVSTRTTTINGGNNSNI